MKFSGGREIGWLTTLLLLGGVYATVMGAVAFAPAAQPVAILWPAAGLAVALIALSPIKRWPALTVGLVMVEALANITAGRPLETSACFGLANAAEAVTAGWILTGGGRRRARLGTSEDLLRLVAASVAGALVVAAGVAFTALLVDGQGFVTPLCTVLTAHATATLTLLPVAISTARAEWAARDWELPVQAVSLAVVTIAAFRPDQGLPLEFLPIPFLAWCALRFDVRTAAIELAAFSAAITFFTARGDGPFGMAVAAREVNLAASTSITQAFLLGVTLLTLPLAVTVQQRVALLDRLSTDELLFRRNFTESLVGMLFLERSDAPGGGLNIVDVNGTAEQILGSGRDELLGMPLVGRVNLGLDFDDAVAAMEAGRIDGWRTESSILGARRGRVTIALSILSGQAGQGGQGGAPLFSAQLLDITSEYVARQRLEAAEQLTSATLDTTACIILVTDLDGVIVRVNAATSQITGYPASELVGRHISQTRVAPSEVADLEALLTWPNRSGVPVVRERDMISRSGKKLRVVWNNNIVRDDDGTPAYAVMTGIDVTAERTSTGLMNHLMQASFTTALIGIDAAGLITVFNSGAQHLLGFAVEEVVGQPFHQLLDPRELLAHTGADTIDEAFSALVDELTHDGETRAKDWTWIARNGRRHTVSMTLSIAEDAFASQDGLLCVGRDVTDQRISQETLVNALDKERTAVERLRALDEAKNDFVSTVSHELRTPITSIIGYTEMLQDGSIVDPVPGQIPMLETIARNSQRLIVICNDLLLLSGLDSGNVTWQTDDVDLCSVVAVVEDAVRPLLIRRNLEFGMVVPRVPTMVTGDRAQLERVVINLVSNAVKFTEDGGRIEVRLARDVDEAVITVHDTGIGIPIEEQSGLFQKFWRSSTAQKRAIQGTGLGLSIVAAIVSAHRGRISVESAHLQGTTFTVRIPLMTVAVPDRARAPQHLATDGVRTDSVSLGGPPG